MSRPRDSEVITSSRSVKDRKEMQSLLGVMVLRGTRSPHCGIRSGTGAENGVVLSSVSLLPENWFKTEPVSCSGAQS